MPKFVPVADPEAPRWEQDEAKLAKHRNFDSHVVARDQTDLLNPENMHIRSPESAARSTHRLRNRPSSALASRLNSLSMNP